MHVVQVVALAHALRAPHLDGDEPVRDAHDRDGHEEEQADERHVIEALGGSHRPRTLVTIGRTELDRPAELGAMGLDKVRPVALHIDAVHIAGHGERQTHRPHEANAAQGLSVRQAPAQRIHNGGEAIARYGHEREHGGEQAGHLQVRVELAEELAERPVLAQTMHGLHGHAGGHDGQIAHGQVEHEAVGRLVAHATIERHDEYDERVADERGEHEQHVERRLRGTVQPAHEASVDATANVHVGVHDARVLGEAQRAAQLVHRLRERLVLGHRLQAMPIAVAHCFF